MADQGELGRILADVYGVDYEAPQLNSGDGIIYDTSNVMDRMPRSNLVTDAMRTLANRFRQDSRPDNMIGSYLDSAANWADHRPAIGRDTLLPTGQALSALNTLGLGFLGRPHGAASLSGAVTDAVLGRMGPDAGHRNYGEAILSAIERVNGPDRSPGGFGPFAGPSTKGGSIPDRGRLPGSAGELPPPSGASNPYVPVPGQPAFANIPGHGRVEVRPIPQIEAAARDYAATSGRPYVVPTEMPPLDPARAARIAEAFEAMQHNPGDSAVRRAYDAMIEETIGQYRALDNQGIQFRFNQPGAPDPYAASPALGYLDMRDRGRLFVFPTLEGFGSGVSLTREQVANNPLLRDTGIMFGDQPATANDLFRAVHDAFGHNGPGNPFFRARGEERAWGHHSSMYSPDAIPAMTSETRGQNSWLNFGPFGAQNRNANALDTIYADQKIGIMPEWTWLEGRPPTKRGD